MTARRTLEQMRLEALAAEMEAAPGEPVPCAKCGCCHFLPHGDAGKRIRTMRCRHCANMMLVPVEEDTDATQDT